MRARPNSPPRGRARRACGALSRAARSTSLPCRWSSESLWNVRVVARLVVRLEVKERERRVGARRGFLARGAVREHEARALRAIGQWIHALADRHEHLGGV